MPHEMLLNSCPHCGETVIIGRAYCPACGAPQPRGTAPKGRTSVVNVVVAVVLVLCAAPFGFVGGACSLMGLQALPSSGGDTQIAVISLGIGLPILAIAIGLCVLAAWLLRQGVSLKP